METIGDWFYHHKSLLIASIIIIMSLISGIFALSKEDIKEETTQISDASIKEEIEEESNEFEEMKEEEQKLWSVDLKGEINKPGVYQVSSDTRIYEVIEIAGGITKKATTENINLSKKISDEMVIYIFSKEEYQRKILCKIENNYEGEITKEITDKKSIMEKNQDNTLKEDLKKISINHATMEELMTLDGIGESKAKSIINYRIEKGGFQNLEELQEVSGIGAALYEKIKDNITL